jgi:hypothetical protein
MFLVASIGPLDIVDDPDNLLADAVEVHHVITKTHCYQAEILLVFLNLMRRIGSQIARATRTVRCRLCHTFCNAS